MSFNLPVDDDDYESEWIPGTSVDISPREDVETALSNSSDDARTPRQGHSGPTKKPSYERVRPPEQKIEEYLPRAPSQPGAESHVSSPWPPGYHPHQLLYPYPSPMYSYPVQPYPPPYPTYYPSKPSQLHGANAINSGKGVPHYLKLRPFRGGAKLDQDVILPLRTRTFSFFTPRDPAPLREFHTFRQARCISGLGEGDHDIASLITEGNDILEVQEQSESCTWVHLQSEVMDLDKFEAQSIDSPSVQNDEKALILALFRQVRNSNEKRLNYGRFLEPTVISLVGFNEDKDTAQDSQSKSATFISMPYLHLQKLQSHNMNDSKGYPVRSLLQHHYGLASTEERDRNQVVCKAYPKAHELQPVHVPQLWCILLNKDKIITAGTMHFKELCDEYIEVEMHPVVENFDLKVDTIRLIDLTGRSYYLALANCPTWFKFLVLIEKSEFLPCPLSDDSWKQMFEIRVGKQVLTERTWFDRMRNHNSTLIELTLTRKQSEIKLVSPMSRSTDLGAGESPASRNPSEIGTVSGLELVGSKIVQSHDSDEQPANYGRASEARDLNVFDFLDEGQVSTTMKGENVANFTSPFNVFDFLEDNPRRETTLLRSEARLKEVQTNRPRTSIFPSPVSTPLLNLAQPSPSKSQDHEARRSPNLPFIPSNSRPRGERNNAPIRPRISLSAEGRGNISPAPNTSGICRISTKYGIKGSKWPQASQPRCLESNKNDADISPIFTWHVDPSPADALRSPTSRSSASIRQAPRILSEDIHDRQGARSSRHEILREILVEADEVAGRLLQNNEEVRGYFDAVSDSSRAHIDRVKASISERSQLPATWEKQKHVVAEAIRLMDAFVAPHDGERSKLEAAFCGAMVEILEGEYTNNSLDILSISTAQYLKVIEEIKLGIYAGSETKPRAHYGVPKALLYAFSHLVLYFCIGCRSNKSTTAPIQGKWFEECREYIVRGKQQLIILHNTGHSGEAEIFKTLDCESIVMLVVQRLVNASRKPVLKTYEQYLYTLELEVRRSPNTAVFDDIQKLVEELSIIEDIVHRQREVLGWLHTSCTMNTNFAAPNHSGHLSLHYIEQSARHIQDILEDIANLTKSAERKTALLQFHIDARKKSNNKAIFVFTTVTVIFLPLSFVSSYLGMNTVDIRNSDSSQNLFWLISVPVTAILVLFLWAITRRRLSRWYGRVGRALGGGGD